MSGLPKMRPDDEESELIKGEHLIRKSAGSRRRRWPGDRGLVAGESADDVGSGRPTRCRSSTTARIPLQRGGVRTRRRGGNRLPSGTCASRSG
jgi:hypothetical protein